MLWELNAKVFSIMRKKSSISEVSNSSYEKGTEKLDLIIRRLWVVLVQPVLAGNGVTILIKVAWEVLKTELLKKNYEKIYF